jgi:predicted enzyme related to lactoylglutathione lyase
MRISIAVSEAGMATKKKAKKKATLGAKAAKKTAPRKAVAKKTAPKKAAAKKASPAKAKLIKHEIVHWEIQAQNPSLLHDFYGEALGWDIDANNEMKYGMVASGGPSGINGGIGGSPRPGSRVLVYAQVASIPALLERIESLGGKTIMPRTDVGPVVMALYEDPEGNVMGLIEPR